MNIKILFAAFAGVLNLGLIIFISLRNRHHTVYRTFILISFCLLMWNLRVVITNLIGVHDTSTIYFQFVERLFFPAVSACLYLLPAVALHFALSFLQIDSKNSKHLLKGSYSLAVLLIVLYISGILPTKIYGYLLELFMLPLFAIALFLIGRAYFRSHRPLERARINLLFIGGVTGVVGAFAEDILTASHINASGVGNIANAAYSLLVAASLFRHRLFDVNLTLRRLAGFLVSFIVLIVIVYVLSEVFAISTFVPYGYLFVVVAIVLIFGNRITSVVEQKLLKKLRSSAEIIAQINSALEAAKNSAMVMRISDDILKNRLNVSEVSFYLYDEHVQSHRLAWFTRTGTSKMWELPGSSYLIRWFKQRKTTEPFIFDEVQHSLKFGSPDKLAALNVYETTREMENIGYEVCIPLMLEKTLQGLIFTGAKSNGRAFSDSDVRFMKLLAHTCTLWLQRYKMLDRMRHLEQLAALGEMAAYVAHEVKNPLAIIRSSAQLISSKAQDDELSQLILDECDDLNRVVTTLLDFTKTSHPHPQKVDLKRNVRACVNEILSNPRFKNIEISIDSQGDMSDVICDPRHLKQILMNLLLNATEATKGKGRIAISMDRGNDCARLRIKDNGPGISYEDQSKVFELFYSTKPGGTGLGLPITRKLLELNNAHMKMSSSPNEGCEIIVELPYWKE